jgi:phosphocarrier protein HPr
VNGGAVQEASVVIASTVGLHARPATMLAKAAAEAKRNGCVVQIRRQDAETFVNAASTLHLLTLGAKFGDSVVVQVAGENEAETLETIVELIATNHDDE